MGFNAARGFVGGAAREDFQNGTLSLCFNAARGFVGGAAKKNDMLVERILCFNAARGFVGGAACHPRCILSFRRGFNAARGFVGGAASKIGFFPAAFCVSMPHAALWVVQRDAEWENQATSGFQCRTRLCGWCSLVALSSFPPRGKKHFWKVSGNSRVLTENM